MKTQLIECIEAQIMYATGIKKALKQTEKGSIFKNKYNKGYYDATSEQINKLNELLNALVEENNQSFELTQIAV